MKKKFLTVLLLLLLALSLILGIRACRKPEEAHTVFPFEPDRVENVEMFHHEGVPAATESANPLDAILYENEKFWDSVYGEVTLSEYCEKFYEDTRIFAVPLKAAYVDMDNDWTDELAVVITELEDTLILRIQDGRVVGQEFPSVFIEELKEDGSFRWRGHRGSHGISVMEFSEPIWATRCIAMQNPDDQQPYYIDPEIFPAYQGMDPGDVFWEISRMQENKPDASWFDLPHGPIPTTPPLVLTESEQALVDVVMRHNPYFDLDKGEMTSPLQYLNDFSETTSMSVNFLKQSAIDFDGDGEAELALWIRVGDFNDYGLLVLHYDGSQVEGQTFVYRQMSELKADGTFMWSGSAGYNGVSRLRFDPDGWEQEVIHQVDYDLLASPYQYMVDGAEATKEDFDRAMDQQLAKESVTWVGMENILELFR